MLRIIKMKLEQYIKNKQPSNYTIDGLQVQIINLGSLDYDKIKSYIVKFQKVMPKFLRRGVKKISVGLFGFLEKRNLTAAYDDGTIYISNVANDDYILDEIVHEAAHSVEELYRDEIYADSLIENEFKSKREILWMRLKDKGFEIEIDQFLKPEYSRKVDLFLYQKVGYPILRSLTTDLFFSPYGSTSLREYFANGFESYWLKEELPRLKRVSPALYRKISSISNMEKEDE